MPSYAAFLRGVSPMNLKMPDLKKSLEGAGFSDVKTVLASGNVVFKGKKLSESTIEKQVEHALEHAVGKKFPVIVRTIPHLQALLDADPYQAFRVSPKAKRVVTFLRSAPKEKLALPIERDGARILALQGRELLSAYVVSDKGPVFMTLIEKACGKEITTRTWDTVKKVVKSGSSE
jgi:uncharacterized protein (DUF1697 family)